MNRGRTPAQQNLSSIRHRRWRPLVRVLRKIGPLRRILYRIALSQRRFETLEAGGNSAAAHQVRWARALEEGSRLPLFVEPAEDERPENFAEHWRQCDCTIIRWFLDRGIGDAIRTVLDVGCGFGFLTEHFVRMGFAVTGVTVNPQEKAECLRRGISVREEDFHFLSAPDGAFDLVISSHALEHSIAPLVALCEWKRVVRPGGFLLVVVPLGVEQDARARFPKQYDRGADAMRFEKEKPSDLSFEEVCAAASTYGTPHHFIVPFYRQLRSWFQLAGLEVLAEGVEDAVNDRIIGVEAVDGRRPFDPDRIMNAVILLRKPVEDHGPQ